jgi:hypothetical protein
MVERRGSASFPDFETIISGIWLMCRDWPPRPLAKGKLLSATDGSDRRHLIRHILHDLWWILVIEKQC